MFEILKSSSCPVCDGTGVITVANGPDDIEQENCGCVTNIGEFEPAKFEDVVEVMGRINQAIYGINPYRKGV
jgi:hypothetical protein